jgi:DNA-binding MarR family transcriptional regulator
VSQNESSVFATLLQRQLGQLVRAYEACDQICSTVTGVTPAQGYTLLSLPEKGYLSMNDLSDSLDLAKSTMTRMVDQLVEKGLVRRKPDAEDRRMVLVGLTDQGRVMRTTLESSLQDFFRQVEAGLREDERPLILRSLERITELVKEVLKNCC